MKKDIVPGTKYIIYQDEKNFRYTSDSLILSSFARCKGTVVDLGAGTGILSFRLIDKVDKFINVEINSETFSMMEKSVEENNLRHKIENYNMDVNLISDVVKNQSVDAVVMNPPYYNNGLKNVKDSLDVARKSSLLEDFIKSAFYVLKDQGRLFIVISANRLIDVTYMMKINRIEPKRIKFVKSKQDKRNYIVLIEGVKNSKPNLVIEKDLIIYKDNELTEEFVKVYKNEEII